MARLSRGASVSRNIMLDRLGANISVNMEAAKGFARTRTPSFSLNSTSGATDSPWRLPGISLAQDYHQEGQSRQRRLRSAPGVVNSQRAWSAVSLCRVAVGEVAT